MTVRSSRIAHRPRGYKQPGARRSELIQQVLPDPAAFAQKLRGDTWLAADYGWTDVLDQAQGARGDDPYGDRAEFVQLVRAAQTLPERREP